MNKKVTAILLLTATLIAPAYAGSTSAQLSVSVEVVARTILTIDSQPANIEITADDVARGYVDVPQAMLFHVRSNAINGYTV